MYSVSNNYTQYQQNHLIASPSLLLEMDRAKVRIRTTAEIFGYGDTYRTVRDTQYTVNDTPSPQFHNVVQVLHRARSTVAFFPTPAEQLEQADPGKRLGD